MSNRAYSILSVKRLTTTRAPLPVSRPRPKPTPWATWSSAKARNLSCRSRCFSITIAGSPSATSQKPRWRKTESIKARFVKIDEPGKLEEPA